MVEPVTTILMLLGLANSLFRIFKRIKKWLKNRDRSLYKENERFMKVLQAYAERNKRNPSK
jgi:hypothetical protein